MPTSHVVDYKIYGEDLQFVEVELDPNETVVAEAGAMMYMTEGVQFETKMGDGSNPAGGLFGALGQMASRAITGESLFMTHFTNRGGRKASVAFAAPYPGTIMAIDLDEAQGELICQKDSFLAAAFGTNVSIAFNKRLGAGLFGGEGFILQRLRGDGMAFIHAGGTIVEKRLQGETLRVDTGCIVAFEKTVTYDIQRAGNLKSMVFGGEGLFLATLSGHGRVWIQSLPFSRLADRILANAPSTGGKSSDEGSVIKGLGNLFQS
ncbi:MAG TPA: TIGR00266 family protein [Anaerolineales bacterium]|nr:TIGR00266 family protein [Anaerolineales bacterium]